MEVQAEGARRAAGLAAGAGAFLATLAAPSVARLGAPWPLVLGVFCAAAALGFYLTSRRPLWIGAATLLACGALGSAAAGPLAAMPDGARATLAVTLLMAAWWISVALPIPATSLVPLVLFPALGILPSGKAAAAYANDNIFLFMGGFILALGIQRWGLHRRIALVIVAALGTRPTRMVLGFMLASAFLSMWISNTATALMMLPIALAVIAALREVGREEELAGFAPALLLGIAYAASIGGLATPIGTPPNISFLRIQQILFPAAPDIAFGRWTLSFLPLTALFLPAAWWLLTRAVHRLGRRPLVAGSEVIRGELRRLGPLAGAERRMAWIFAATAVLWLSRGDLDLGALRVPGWAGLLERWIGAPFASGNLHDATVAVAMAILTFLVPGDPDEKGRGRALMDWQTAVKLPWGILLLFGGGFALAGAFVESGLSRWLAETFAGHVAHLHPLLLVGATCLLLTFLTEVTSNTATTEVMLPVLGSAAGAIAVHPLLLMLPATLSSSCAFMLPIATPPNAIVFGSGEIEMRQMVRAGIWLNLVGVGLISLYFYLVAPWLLGIDLSVIPRWAVL